MAPRCRHAHILVSPVEERALGQSGLKDFRELTHFTVYCFSCKKEVARYTKSDAAEAIKKDFYVSMSGGTA